MTDDTTKEILPDHSVADRMGLELLGKARERRELDIIEAAKRARTSDDRAERDVSYAGVLAQEALAFHRQMVKLNRGASLRRAVSKFAVQRGEVTHHPQRPFGDNNYDIITPVMLETSPELIGDSRVSDGYIFSTEHQRRSYKGNPTVVIAKVLKDHDSGEIVTSRYEYIIHTYGGSEHPYALLTGDGIVEKETDSAWTPLQDVNDPRYEVPIGLLRLANEALPK